MILRTVSASTTMAFERKKCHLGMVRHYTSTMPRQYLHVFINVNFSSLFFLMISVNAVIGIRSQPQMKLLATLAACSLGQKVHFAGLVKCKTKRCVHEHIFLLFVELIILTNHIKKKSEDRSLTC